MPTKAAWSRKPDSIGEGWTHSNENQVAHGAYLVSLAFWLILLLATVLYASVALSPKLVLHLDLEARFYRNQVHLVGVERQIEQLERVARALEQESSFAAELARVDFDAHRPGDERIAVEADLRLDARGVSRSTPVPVRSAQWYGLLAKLMATDRKLRALFLTTSVILVILGFTFLHESQEHFEFSPGRPLLNWIVQRYQTPVDR